MRPVSLDSKWWTKDCESCPCRLDDICLWGIRDKRLVKCWSDREHKPRHCEYINRPPMRSELTPRESRYITKFSEVPKYVMNSQPRLL